MPARLGARGHDPSRNCCACLREVWSADCDTIKPLESSANPLRSDWKLSNHFVIGYSGNLGRAHDIETLLEAISAIDAPNSTDSAALQVRWLHRRWRAVRRIEAPSYEARLKGSRLPTLSATRATDGKPLSSRRPHRFIEARTRGPDRAEQILWRSGRRPADPIYWSARRGNRAPDRPPCLWRNRRHRRWGGAG